MVTSAVDARADEITKEIDQEILSMLIHASSLFVHNMPAEARVGDLVSFFKCTQPAQVGVYLGFDQRFDVFVVLVDGRKQFFAELKSSKTIDTKRMLEADDIYVVRVLSKLGY